MHDQSMEMEFARARALEFEPYTLFRVPAMTGRYLNVHPAGYRHGRRPFSWPPDPQEANVFVLGGSTAFGYGVADGETIASQLGDQLGSPVYNFASPNYTSVQERIRFEQLLLQGHRPRVAVFVDGFDDFIAPFYEPMMFAPFVTAAKRRRLFDRFLRREKPAGRMPDCAVVVDRYLTNMRLIKAAAQQFGVHPVFVWQPVPCYQYAGPAADHGSSAPLIECVQRGYEMMDARRGGIDGLLWLADMQRGRTDALYIDPDHYTAAFSGEIASRIGQHLVKTGWMRS